MPIDEPFEYLSFGGTFSRTFSLWMDRVEFFTTIAGIVLLPFAVLFVTIALVGAIWILEEDEIPDFHPKHIPLVTFIFGLQYVVYSLATIIGRGAICLAVARMYVGEPVTVMECLKDAWAKKFTLISVSAIMGAAMLIGVVIVSICLGVAIAAPNGFTIFLAVISSLAVIAAGFYWYIGIVLTNASIMVENLSGPIQGMKRSWELVAGSRCYLICALFCLWLMNDLVSRLFHNLFVGGDVMDVFFSVVGILISVLPLVVYFPMHAILETVMYLNLRIGRESMNHAVLSGDLVRDASSAPRAFRHDEYTPASTAMVDYRHVPLMDQEEPLVGNEMI